MRRAKWQKNGEQAACVCPEEFKGGVRHTAFAVTDIETLSVCPLAWRPILRLTPPPCASQP